MVQGRKDPELAIKRLSVYLRVLDSLIEKGIELVNSESLSKETGFTAELIRKDLSHFGAFGTRGRGYYTDSLRQCILKVSGLNNLTTVIVVGAGHLGTALTRYTVTKNPYVKVVAVFDVDPAIIGQHITAVEIMHISKMEEIVAKHKVDVAILTVPSGQAQSAFDSIVQSGVKIISNFVPVKLTVPEGVYVHNTDLSVDLQSLKYHALKYIDMHR
ncbi:MAG: redox-sensing transcriptional repressor Rex [Bacillota bacterium]|nr:redox-sensing transcriptional repressor Rex [Bacillota bacterium]